MIYLAVKHWPLQNSWLLHTGIWRVSQKETHIKLGGDLEFGGYLVRLTLVSSNYDACLLME